MPDHISKPVKDMLERGASQIYNDIEVSIPVNRGALKESLHKAKRSNGFRWFVGWWMKGNLRKWRKAGWRAHFIEFGTSKTPAHPMVGPSYRKNESKIKGLIKAAVNRALRQASNL